MLLKKAIVSNILGSSNYNSSIIGIVKDYILSIFPKNYIKTVHITSTLVELLQDGKKDDEIAVKDLPALSIDLDTSYDEATFVTNFPFTKHNLPQNIEYNNSYNQLVHTEDSFITGLDNRQKLNINLKFKVNSQMQAYNIIQYIKGRLGFNRPFVLHKVPVEVPIPNKILNSLYIKYKNKKAIDFTLKNEFNEYLKKISNGNILFKKHESSGEYLYFAKYLCNILCKINNDPPKEEQEEKNKIKIASEFEIPLSVEFMYFVGFVSTIIIDNEDELRLWNMLNKMEDGEPRRVYTAYNVNLAFRKETEYELLHTLDIITDINTTIDTTSLKDDLPEDVKTFIQSKDESLVIDVLYYNHILIQNVDYEMIYDDLELRIINPFENSCYRINIYKKLNI